MTVQEIVNEVSADMRQVLGATGSDGILIANWVNRIQKDMLRSSCYSYVARGVLSIQTVAGQNSYPVTSVSFRNVFLLYDRTNNRRIPPIDEGLGPGEEGSAASTNTTRPNYFTYDGTAINIYPIPSSLEPPPLLEVHYNINAGDVSLGSNLPFHPAARDVIVAGTNMLASAYLKNIDEMNRWSSIYEAGKKG